MNKTYICSDIHGDLPGYLKLLKTIEFDDTDCMIIAGDVLDRGEYGIELFDYVHNQPNVTMLLGNHEMFAIMYFQGTLSANTWALFGGEHKLEAMREIGLEIRLRMWDKYSNRVLIQFCAAFLELTIYYFRAILQLITKPN